MVSSQNPAVSGGLDLSFREEVYKIDIKFA